MEETSVKSRWWLSRNMRALFLSLGVSQLGSLLTWYWFVQTNKPEYVDLNTYIVTGGVDTELYQTIYPSKTFLNGWGNFIKEVEMMAIVAWLILAVLTWFGEKRYHRPTLLFLNPGSLSIMVGTVVASYLYYAQNI